MIKVILTIFILLYAVSINAQNSFLRQKCPSSQEYFSLSLRSDGNIFSSPCVGKSFRLLDANAQFSITPYLSNFEIINSDSDNSTDDGLPVTTNYFTSILDLELNASVGSKIFTNNWSALRVKGNTPNSGIYNQYIYTDNRWETSTSTNLYSVYAFTNIEASAASGYGGYFGALLGNLNTTPLIVGVAGTAGGHGGGGQYIAGDFLTTQTSDGATSPLFKGIRIQVKNPAFTTMTDVRGISLEGWTHLGAVINSYGIYADSSIDSGNTRYFIYSLSTSPSLFTGDITTGGKLYVSTSQTPATASEACTKGQFAYDDNFEYRCVQTNTWKRVAIATW